MTLPPFRYTERVPGAALAPWILSLWSFEAAATAPPEHPYTVWPDGCLSIAVLCAPHRPTMLVCVGPRLTALHPPVVAGQQLWGFRLWPDVIEAVTGLAARSLRDRMGLCPPEIEARFGALSATVRGAGAPTAVFDAIEVFLGRVLQEVAAPDERIRAAVRAIAAGKGEVAMADVARAAGVGLRHLQRRFPATTGLTLREYARVRRLREALSARMAERSVGWSRIAAETGFADHAHLTREFVTLTGVVPSVAARQLARTAHDDVQP